MAAGHAHPLFVHGHSPVHRLAPEAKLAAAFAFVAVVAVTPADRLWVFAAHAGLLVAVVVVARLRPLFVLKRAVVVLPFIAFIVLIPFVASGERTEILGLSVSAEGLAAARTILIRSLIGVTVSIILAATTELPAIMRGLNRLKVPSLLTTIAMFMLRYLETLTAELGRMRTAMTARAYDPRWLWQAKPIAQSAGTLFIRSYERSERVHNAMLARGFTGQMPASRHPTATPREWLAALALPVAALVALLIGVVVS
ncbi:cobalt ECF transporter T component CbiQ [Euzebya tangerina]|uniref:cobalt ECF transporter T component CbiQ n=1 Tax=Euzebya tangerina TaxID=591198 RepID=UPI000E317287|nr:cobalt ECF transporter T component CbiQ [Euzebya tangerina]